MPIEWCYDRWAVILDDQMVNDLLGSLGFGHALLNGCMLMTELIRWADGSGRLLQSLMPTCRLAMKMGFYQTNAAMEIAGVAILKWRRCKVRRLMSSDLDEWAAGLKLPWRTRGRNRMVLEVSSPAWDRWAVIEAPWEMVEHHIMVLRWSTVIGAPSGCKL
ncbi:hypothetical protein ACLOJK_014732 [Asimina triloba]